MDTDTPPPLLVPTETPPLGRTIAGFWRRVAALLLDSLLLGGVGLLAGLFLFDFLAGLGGAGRLVGFFVALTYFGLCNSALGEGRTPGKRIMGLEVVDASGQHLSPARSALRYAILGVPYFLNGALLPPILLLPPIGYVIGFLVLGLGGAILYLIVFNRRTRQSVHDLAVGSFVVRTGGAGAVAAGPVWRGHFVALGVLALALVGGSIAVGHLAGTAPFQDLLVVQEKLQATGKMHAATMSFGKNWSVQNGTRTECTFLQSTAVWRSEPENPQDAAREVAQIIVSNYPGIADTDLLVVSVVYGYDIGIARAWQHNTSQFTPNDWATLQAGAQ